MASNADDILRSIRTAVGETLGYAEADSKLTKENKELLAQLILTRRGDGELVLDISALQRLKATDHQWTDKARNEQDRLINPTRLPQLIPGLNGLQSSQYLAFVQRPLDRKGANAPFLELASIRLVDQYNDKALAGERNKIFGPMQRYVAKLLIDELLQKTHNIKSQEELDKLREATTPQQQFELASKALNIPTNEVMNRLFKLGVALTLIERIKTKAAKIKKAQSKFEGTLRKLASGNTGPTAKTRIKEIYLGYQHEMQQLVDLFNQIPKTLQPLIQKMNKDNFGETYYELHLAAAKLDALASRWTIIITESGNPDPSRSEVEKIKGMHEVFLN